MPELIIKPVEKPKRETIGLNSLKDKPRVEKVYEAEKVNLSENIRAFDKKPRIYTENPYSYNYHSLKKEQEITPSASQMVANPLYNTLGKILGLDTTKEWNLYYDKIYQIAEWAKKELKTDDVSKISDFIANKGRTVPTMGSRRIDDIYIYSKMSHKSEPKPRPRVVTKTVVKKVFVEKKLSESEMIDRLVKGWS